MKTALRTYHPVPSLQKTDGNAQDAPRIKNCLKAALLPSELKSLPPTSPDEIIATLVRSSIHPTCYLSRSDGCLEKRKTTANKCCELDLCPVESRSGQCLLSAVV